VSAAAAPTKPIGSVLMQASNISAWDVKDNSVAVHDVFTHPDSSSTLVVVMSAHEIHP
jgi:hypothetical protein